MKKYLYLYYNKPGKGGLNEDWENWFKELGDKAVDIGNPLDVGGQAVSKDGVMDVKDIPATGYSLIKASDMDEAVELSKSCPVTKENGGAVCVYETLPM